MVVFPAGKYGDPIYSCLACHEKGSLRDLLCDLWSLTGSDHYQWIELLDNDAKSIDEAVEYTARERAKNLGEKAGFGTKAEGYIARSEKQKNALKKQEKLTPLMAHTEAKVFYDYIAANKSDEMPEIPWETYEPHAGSVPLYATEQRGLTIDTCREWELGHDKNGCRLLFPMRDRGGRLVAISGRLYRCSKCGLEPPETISPNVCTACGHIEYGDMEDGIHCSACDHSELKRQRAVCAKCHGRASPKYLHSKGFKRNLMLYGENRYKVDRTDGRIYLVEGHLDALSMWQAGYRPVNAILGSYPSESQIEKVIRDNERVVVVGDGDQSGAGIVAVVKKMVADRIPVSRKLLPNKTDPNKLLQEGRLEEVMGPAPMKS
jgi:5S rRNA maturation endonuclease (ribonuclease M5)